LSGKLGVKKDGTITALQVNLVTDAGAYFSHSAAASSVCMRYFLGLYRCPNTLGEADIVYTNTPMTGGMRGYGDPGATFAREQLIDMAAERLGVDPLEFRLKNAKATGEPSTIPTISIESSALDECIRLGAERFGWQGKRGLARQGTIKRGMGMACLTHNSNAFPTLLENSNAVIKLNPDGSVNLLVSACEMGQGILGVLAQIAAEVLGINAGDVHVITGDTDTTPFDVGAHASRSTNVLGNAVLGAAQEVKNQLLLRAAKMLEAAAGELETNNGRIHIKASSEKGVSIAEVARNATYNYQGDSQDVLGKCSFVPQLSAAFQATFAEVEVDAETGQLKVLKIVIAADVGRAINPTSVEGQLEGSVVQGIGYALSEETVINNEGITVTDSFASYKIPTTLDLPEIEVILVEHPIASGPFGAKGLGELGIGAVAPAIVSAVCDAVGVRITELPITPEKILDGLRILTKE
ncbi:MAG: molybdopterin-dependent oxidoreductase, partial [Deltaproteobacteria bacterium]|nr:molybdopterin-dependent oxidoreductase [Deltaproteobacteria bacterium]